MDSYYAKINDLKNNIFSVVDETIMSDNKSSFNFGFFYIAFAAFLWTTDILVRTNLEGKLSATQITLVDHLIIVIVISPLIVKYFPKLLKFNLKEWLALLWIGIGGSALATIALTEGFFTGDFQFQNVAVVILMQQTQPIVAIGLAHLLLKEKLPNLFYLLSLFAIIGVGLIISPFIFVGGSFVISSQISNNTGLMAGMFGLIAAILWGSSTVFGRYLLKHGVQKPEYKEMVTYRFFIAAIFLVIFTPFIPRSDGYPSIEGLLNIEIMLSLLFLALIVGLLSLVLYYYGLKTTHASMSAIAELAYPLSFFVIMPLLKVDTPSLIQLIGAAVLLVSTTLLSYNYGKTGFKIKSESTPSSQ